METDWPDDWRERAAGGDEKIGKALGRFASPKAVAEALVAAQNRIRSGEVRAALPDKPTDAELSAWRKDNGIPETSDKYDLKYGNGLIIGEDDKPIIDGFLKTAHAANMRPEQARQAVEWYYQEQERQTQERADRDETQRTEALDALNNEWGTGFRANVTRINSLLDKFPAAVRDSIKAARLPDGRGLFNSPDVLRGFVALALELDPAGTLVPGGSGDPMKGIDEEIAAIEKSMGTKAYQKDEVKQARYRDLIDAREKMKERKAA